MIVFAVLSIPDNVIAQNKGNLEAALYTHLTAWGEYGTDVEIIEIKEVPSSVLEDHARS